VTIFSPKESLLNGTKSRRAPYSAGAKLAVDRHMYAYRNGGLYIQSQMRSGGSQRGHTRAEPPKWQAQQTTAHNNAAARAGKPEAAVHVSDQLQ
jgi:hypothetical protein